MVGDGGRSEVEHPLLNIDGRHLASRAGALCEAPREVARPGADIRDARTFGNVKRLNEVVGALHFCALWPIEEGDVVRDPSDLTRSLAGLSGP